MVLGLDKLLGRRFPISCSVHHLDTRPASVAQNLLGLFADRIDLPVRDRHITHHDLNLDPPSIHDL